METGSGESMNSIHFDEMVDMAEKLRAAGTPWHFHMIGPNCILDRTTPGFALILEDESNGNLFTCHFPDRPVSQTHKMALLCYGPDFLTKEKIPVSTAATGKNPPNADFQEIMQQARSCHASGTVWHNHHLPPRCKFNPQPGRHCIVFENEADGLASHAYYEHDPVDDLAELEAFLFAE